MQIDEKKLLEQLNKTDCKQRLYPSLLFALQLLTGKNIEGLIDSNILQQLYTVLNYEGAKLQYKFSPNTIKLAPPRIILSPESHQFIWDFSVYGLRESILYLKNYDFPNDPSLLLKGSATAYNEIASCFIDSRNKLVSSKDETIKELLLITKMQYGDVIRKKYQGKQRRARIPSKRKLAEMLRVSLEFDDSIFADELTNNEVLEYYSADKKYPKTYVNELINFIELEFMFENRPSSFQGGLLQVADILYEFGIEPKSKLGQKVIKTYISDAKEGRFGDICGYTICENCGLDFLPKYTPKYVSIMLDKGTLCRKCVKKI